MPLVKSKDMLLNAKKKHYAIGAFNIENLEMAKAVIEAAFELSSPVILAISESASRYMDLKIYFSFIKTLADEYEIPIALHLDHGESFDICMKALYSGFTSIMIDGSKLSYKKMWI